MKLMKLYNYIYITICDHEPLANPKTQMQSKKREKISILCRNASSVLAGLFLNCLDKAYIVKADKTTFSINVNNGRTLGFSGEQELQYADDKSGEEGS